MAKNIQITIEFTNDGGSGDTDKNVYFRSDQITEIEGPTKNWEANWNCGSEEENYRCNRVRNGNLKWGGEYVITLGKLIVWLVIQSFCYHIVYGLYNLF